MPPAPGAVAMAAMVDPCIVVPFRPGPWPPGQWGVGGLPAARAAERTHFRILQLILPRFFAKRYTHRWVFPHLPKSWWKNEKNYFNFVVPESLRTAWGSIFTGGFSPGRLRPFSDSLALSVKSCGFASSPKGRALGKAAKFTAIPTAPPGGAVAQRLRGHQSAEPKKTVKRSSRQSGVNLQFFPVEPTSLGLSRASSPGPVVEWVESRGREGGVAEFP